MKSKALPYLLLTFFSVILTPASNGHSSVHETENLKCFVYGCYGYLSKSLDIDPRGDVYECSEGHKFVIRR